MVITQHRLLFRNLPGDLPGELVANLRRVWVCDPHLDILATLPRNLFGHLMAIVEWNAFALLVVAMVGALLPICNLARILIDCVVIGLAILLELYLVVRDVVSVALFLVDGLVDGLVGGGITFDAVSVTVAATVRNRICGT